MIQPQTGRNNEAQANGLGLNGVLIPPSPEGAGYIFPDRIRSGNSAYIAHRLFRPFRARVSVWVSLTQAVGLGFVISPLWGSPAHTLN